MSEEPGDLSDRPGLPLVPTHSLGGGDRNISHVTFEVFL